jgi:hypothetical protein
MNTPGGQIYPARFEAAEEARIQERRQQCRVDAGIPKVGIALSGGGIRSATFCLGWFQALARQKLIGKIDFLSTVSGGGYFGSFFGALFQRANPAGVTGVETILADSDSWEVRWLRENGRYLSPNGSGGLWMFAAAMLRNWVAMHVVLLTFLLLPLLLASLIRGLVWAGAGHATPCEIFFGQHCFLSVWWSPFLLLPLLTFLLMMLPMGSIYWLTQHLTLVRLMQKTIAVASKPWEKLTEREARNRLQTLFTQGLMVSLLITLALLAFAVVDSLGQTIYARWAAKGFSFPSIWAGFSAVGLAVMGLAQKISALLEKLPGHRAVKIPVNLLILLAALTWVSLIFLGLSVVAHGLAWQWQPPFQTPFKELSNVGATSGTAAQSEIPWPYGVALGEMPGMGIFWLAGVALFTLLLALWFGHVLGFINLSSQQQLYSARLKRAYIGASNPLRREANNHDVTNPLPGDDIPFAEYQPHRHGGPLHFVNVTVNETVSGKSQIEQRDRKGISLAVGPCGISVGTKDHALWNKVGSEVEPLVGSTSRSFHTLLGNKPSHQDSESDPTTVPSHPVEALGLGHWVSISGAAFTTGMGSNTSLGLSLLMGLANVRLGYWWDCGVKPDERTGRTKPGFSARAGEFFARIFPAQSYLFDEFLARFHGPARSHWYLSDGGHFENTAAYELIRRRVPFIIVSDAGRDMSSSFEDIANLTRKARIDFNAEIEFIRRTAPGAGSAHLPTLEQLVHPDLLDVIGTPEDFVPVPGAAADEKDGNQPPGYSTKHALLARVRYLDDAQKFSWMLFLKPSLTGDEPTDVLQYQKTQPDFPQESTADQFFDEAQWESYRKLGEHIGNLVFAGPTGKVVTGKPDWRPHDMSAPKLPGPASPSFR